MRDDHLKGILEGRNGEAEDDVDDCHLPEPNGDYKATASAH